MSIAVTKNHNEVFTAASLTFKALNFTSTVLISLILHWSWLLLRHTSLHVVYCRRMQRAMQFTSIQKGRQAVALMFDRRSSRLQEVQHNVPNIWIP